MKSILPLAAFVVFSLLVSCMADQAGKSVSPLGDKSAGAAAEAFLAGYIKSDAQNSAWVAKTPLVTPEVKTAFTKAMASDEVDADPVLFAQDVPTTPFRVESCHR